MGYRKSLCSVNFFAMFTLNGNNICKSFTLLIPDRTIITNWRFCLAKFQPPRHWNPMRLLANNAASSDKMSSLSELFPKLEKLCDLSISLIVGSSANYNVGLHRFSANQLQILV